jgi:hypothetical protein
MGSTVCKSDPVCIENLEFLISDLTIHQKQLSSSKIIDLKPILDSLMMMILIRVNSMIRGTLNG